MAAAAVSPPTVLLVLRASRPTFRNRHDGCVFAVHAAILSAGFRLVATGQAALGDPPPSDKVKDEPEVGVEGWNEVDGVYAFRYKGEGNLPIGVTMRCLSVEDILLIDVVPEPLEPLSAPLHAEISLSKFLVETNSQNYADHFSDLQGLLNLFNKDILLPLTKTADTGVRGTESVRDVLQDRERPRGGPGQGFIPPSMGEGNMGGYRPPFVPGIGSDDLLPGGGGGVFFPRRGGGGDGMMLGPNDPYWGRVGGEGNFPVPGQNIPGVPPGARYDPIGPPGIRGFEPNRFIRGGRGNPSRPPGHPDLEFFRDD